MSKILIAIFFSLMLFEAGAQTCSIVSSDIVCREELMSFDVTASAGISSVSWDMGDATTSTQQSFSHKYSTKGPKIVKVTINLTGGGTCIASKKVTVYGLPEFKISQRTGNIYCLWQNNICLVDSSTGGNSAVKIKKRIVLWDDGNQSVDNNPPMGDIVCHHYDYPGTYKVTIELTNDKDCKSETFMNITILKDVVPEISVFSIDNDNLQFCDSARTEFYDNTKDTATINSRIYDWGDGSPKITTKSTHLWHFYKNSGTYKVSLAFIQKNGCITTKDTVIDVIVYRIVFDITKNANKQCLGDFFRIRQNDLLTGAYYWWSSDQGLLGDGYDLKFIDDAPTIGKHYFFLKIDNHGCIKFAKDSVEVIGFTAKVIVLNGNQCDNQDTVFFRTKVRQYGIGKLSYFWDFGDDKAPQCTTSWVDGVNVNGNCNFSTDSLGKHFYVNGKCRNYNVSIQDTTSGCPSNQFTGKINVLKPDSIKFQYKASRFCIGTKSAYHIGFSHDFCSSVGFKVNLDSACDKDRFSSRFVSDFAYKEPCDKDGWVTVGLALEFGSRIIFRGFSDTSNFYVDSGRICFDTIWKHKWFQLGTEPDVSFDPNMNCLKHLTKPIIIDSIQNNISFTSWSWGDNSPIDTIPIAKGDSVIPRPGHIYKKAGIYMMKYHIENERGCFDEGEWKVTTGFNMMMLDFDAVICPGSMVLVRDSMRYLDSITPAGEIIYGKNYWHVLSRKQKGMEEFKWNFDDGRGFLIDTANPVVSFPQKGFYNIQLAAKDSTNCWDTLTRLVNVGSVHAGIKNIYKRIICDGIVQLYDSSYSDYKPPLDSIAKYYWDFGDGGNPSFVQNPFHYYSTFGNYTIFQRVESSRGCFDTAFINIVIEGPVANFDIADTVGCAPFTAHFDNKSIKTKDYIWYFGDPLKSKLFTNRDTNVRFTYKQPGTYYIYLFGSDSVKNPNAGNAIYYCKTFFPDTNAIGHPVRKIVVLPAPKADFSVNTIQCKNKPIVVTANSDSLYTLHKWLIPGGDSLSTPNISGTLISKDTGVFTIRYAPWYQHTGSACLDTVRKTVRVTAVNATFDILKDSGSCPIYTFVNTSKGFKNITWNLGDPGLDQKNNTKTENQFSFRYSQKGKFSPCLYAENFNGCFDTLCTEVSVDVIKKLIIPNVFTPGNNDLLNDAFDIVAEGLEEYHLVIYNRWGQKLFETFEDGVGDDGSNWRGRPNITSSIYPDGTYFYILNYKFKCEEKEQEAHGTITLIGDNE